MNRSRRGRRPATRRKGALKQLKAHYTRLHWGIEPDRVLHVDDPLLPDLVAMGRLAALNINLPQPGGEVLESVYEFPAGCWLGVEVEHPRQRLHLICTGRHQEKVRRLFFKHRREAVLLGELAAAVGGEQAGYPYPEVLVVPLAEVTDIIYFTHKKGDGPSGYIHAFSEDTHGPKPWLAADAEGRMFLAGGSYLVSTHGVEN